MNKPVLPEPVAAFILSKADNEEKFTFAIGAKVIKEYEDEGFKTQHLLPSADVDVLIEQGIKYGREQMREECIAGDIELVKAFTKFIKELP